MSRTTDKPHGLRHRTRRPSAGARAAFTLVEMMVAVGILIVVILGVGKIFGTVGRVTTVGEANSGILQGLPALERAMRDDLRSLSHDGFMVIRNISVPNDVRGSTANLLLDPDLPANARFRCDQILFFANGRGTTKAFAGTAAGGENNHQATVSRIYYGHAYQIPAERIPAGKVLDAAGNDTSLTGLLTPWAYEQPGDTNLDLAPWPSGAAVSPINGTQPRPANWVVSRQAVLLADDGGDPNYFYSTGSGINSAASIWPDPSAGDWVPAGSNARLRNGRVDIAATQMNDIRRLVMFDSNGNPRPWDTANGQRAAMIDALFFPRAERVAPTMYRADQMLVGSAIASGIRSLAIDWTWADGVGRVTDRNGLVIPDAATGFSLNGMTVPPTVPQPWFGLPDATLGTIAIDSDIPGATVPFVQLPIIPGVLQNIYTVPAYNPSSAGINVVETVFGFNDYQPLNAFGSAHADMGYTPWPTALRVTLLVGDPRGRTDVERPVQFVINLPSREE